MVGALAVLDAAMSRPFATQMPEALATAVVLSFSVLAVSGKSGIAEETARRLYENEISVKARISKVAR